MQMATLDEKHPVVVDWGNLNPRMMESELRVLPAGVGGEAPVKPEI